MCEPDVYISYSQNDIVVAERLARCLESAWLKCWYASRDIAPDADQITSITGAIQKAPYFILILSDSSNESAQVCKEVAYVCGITEESHTVIIFRISNVEISGCLSYYIDSKQRVDATEDLDQACISVANQIRDALGVTTSSQIISDCRVNDERDLFFKIASQRMVVADCLASNSPATDEDTSYRRKTGIQSSGWICPECGKQNNSGKFCASCGARRIVAESQNASLEERNFWRCPECGRRNNYSWKFCGHCGTRRVDDYDDTEIPKDSESECSSESSAADNLRLRAVEFSAVAPKMILKGDYTLIDVIMYEESFRYVVDRKKRERESDEPTQESRSGIHRVEDNSRVKIVLHSPDIILEEDTEEGIWRGGFLNFSFKVFLPERYERRQILFNASVYINDIIATRLKFIVKCSSLLEQKIKVTRNDVFSAFMSYASQDRKQVAAIVQGMMKARPDMDIFFDIESLRSGENWEQALYREIENRDILFLCWSCHARESEWVDKEWRYALTNKGEESVEPVPIDPPDVCPPPKELEHKHFNDKLLYIMSTSCS